jgi:hypothetical protein
MSSTVASDVETGRNYWGNEMIWIGESLTLSGLLDRYLYLKENYGLSNARLAFSVGLAESSLSRIFNKKHKPNRTTLIALDVALNEWEYHLEGDDE